MSDAPISGEQSAQEVINETEEVVDQPISDEGLEASEASDSELEDIIDDEEASEEEVQEAKQELAKRMSLKINGKEQEFDLGNDADIERLKQFAQKGEGADQKFQEAAKIRKQMEAFVTLMQQDPIKALQQLGHDPDDLAEKHMQRRIEEMQKSPEQLEREKIQKELEDMRKEKERLENEKFESEQMRLQEEYARQLDQELSEALEESKLPRSPYVVKRIAENLRLAIQKKPDISVKDILPVVERQITSEIQQMFGALPEDVIEQLLGNDVSNRLRKRRLNKMKKAVDTASSIKPTGAAEINKAKAQEETSPVSVKDFFKNI